MMYMIADLVGSWTRRKTEFHRSGFNSLPKSNDVPGGFPGSLIWTSPRAVLSLSRAMSSLNIALGPEATKALASSGCRPPSTAIIRLNALTSGEIEKQ